MTRTVLVGSALVAAACALLTAGTLVARCLEIKRSPKALRASRPSVEALQARLKSQGVDIAWPKVTPR